MYRSPIEVLVADIQHQIAQQQDEEIYKAVVSVGINVDKEELIRALAYDRHQYMKGHFDGVEEATPKWIPVAERLPEVGCDVLFMCQSKDYGVGAYSDTYKDFFMGQFPVKGVTHWMPLPEPPKGGADDV